MPNSKLTTSQGCCIPEPVYTTMDPLETKISPFWSYIPIEMDTFDAAKGVMNYLWSPRPQFHA